MPKPDWLWLLVGVAVGLIVHQTLSHPKSPLRLGGTSFFTTPNFGAE